MSTKTEELDQMLKEAGLEVTVTAWKAEYERARERIADLEAEVGALRFAVVQLFRFVPQGVRGMTKEQEYEKAYLVISAGMLMLVEVHMGWDPAKALKWMSTENPHLGNMTPKQLILSGRAHKVLQFIEARIDREPWE